MTGRLTTTHGAVLLDFYGTLARATRWVSADEVLAEHGYQLDDESRAIYFADGIDGIEHDEHSQSRDHYVAWQRERTLAMLAEIRRAPGRVRGDPREAPRRHRDRGRSRPTTRSPRCSPELRARGLRLVICSNWDWDLTEAVDEAGSPTASTRSSRRPGSAPASRTRASTRTRSRRSGSAAEAALFVGDTWGPDVEGPLGVGIRPVYLRRDGHWPDGTCPHDDPTGPGRAGARRPPRSSRPRSDQRRCTLCAMTTSGGTRPSAPTPPPTSSSGCAPPSTAGRTRPSSGARRSSRRCKRCSPRVRPSCSTRCGATSASPRSKGFVTDIAFVRAEIDYTLAHLDAWLRPEKVHARSSSSPARRASTTTRSASC